MFRLVVVQDWLCLMDWMLVWKIFEMQVFVLSDSVIVLERKVLQFCLMVCVSLLVMSRLCFCCISSGIIVKWISMICMNSGVLWKKVMQKLVSQCSSFSGYFQGLCCMLVRCSMFISKLIMVLIRILISDICKVMRMFLVNSGVQFWMMFQWKFMLDLIGG